jgi:hypothetical protein
MTKPRRKQTVAKVKNKSSALTQQEKDRVRTYLERRDSRPRVPQVKVDHKVGEAAQVRPDHAEPGLWAVQMDQTFGTVEPAFSSWLHSQLLNATHCDRSKPLSEDAVNGAQAAVHGIAPRDETEAMLAVQMVATHHAAMEFMRQAVSTDYRHTLQDAGNLAVKLMRTYTAQMEALSRYRGKTTQQKVAVEHVRVHQGAQAIVGHVQSHGREVEGDAPETGDQAHEKALTLAPEPAMWCPDEEGDVVPVTGDAERSLPATRR